MIPFGTLCMFHMAGNESLSTFDPRSEIGIALGPSHRSRAFLVKDANELCFEKIIKRSSISDIDETLSIEAIQQFKKTAYQ